MKPVVFYRKTILVAIATSVFLMVLLHMRTGDPRNHHSEIVNPLLLDSDGETRNIDKDIKDRVKAILDMVKVKDTVKDRVNDRVKVMVKDPGQEEERSAATKILLITKGRSGSTLTAAIIRASPSVFYTFEPLMNLMLRRHLEIDKGVPADKAEDLALYNKESADLISTFLDCRLDQLRKEDVNNYQLRNSPDSQLLWMCAHKGLSSQSDCVLNAKKVCQSRMHNLVKVIRLRVRSVREMLAEKTDVKLMYLVRDPRGTISSMKKSFPDMFSWDDIQNFSAIHCTGVLEDLLEMKNLTTQHPERAMVLRYESLAEDPQFVSAKLYAYLGLEFTPQVRQFVSNRTQSDGDDGNYGTSRKSSIEAAYSWRKSLKVDAARAIDANCGEVYRLLGYLPLASEEELRNVSRSLRTHAEFTAQ